MSTPAFLRIAVVALLGTALAGCHAHAQRAQREAQVDNVSGRFIFEYDDADRDAKGAVAAAVDKASPGLSRWGGLREPVRLRILPSHAALEDAVGRSGYDWLRAWARYDEIYMQSPSTWTLIGASQKDVDELLLHELTHVVMYQQAADGTHWSRKAIPLWFREGMASFTADQGYRWPSLEDLARYLLDHPDADPVGSPEPLYQRDSELVYGAAHHAFAFLVRRYGEDRVKELLHEMRRDEDTDFSTAFTRVIGIPQDAFVEDFRRYLRMRGFKGGRLLQPRPPALDLQSQ